MTINDMMEHGIRLQGAFIIKHWDDEKETYNILTEGSMFEDEYGYMSKKELDAEVKFMYCQNNVLNIEI